MSALRKMPLCDRCRATDGWLYDETGDEPLVEQCPCRRPQASGDALRDGALAYTAEGNPQAFKDALSIIRQTALSMPVFSSNDTRHQMKIKGIPGECIGAAFRQAAKDRVIRRIGYVTSTDAGTHAHPVVEWESVIFRRATA